MPESVTAPSAEAPRDRSLEARRAARIRKFERERLIVDYLNRGVPVAEIAGRIGVTEKRMRALVKEILARRMPEAPEEFAAIQVSRLNEALMVAYSAMSPDNLKAVALVVRIVRELDRYHGFRASPFPALLAKVSGQARRIGCGKQDSNSEGRLDRSCESADVEAAGRTASVVLRDTLPSEAGEGQRPVIGSETALQTIEKIESAPENVALANGFGAAPPRAGAACPMRADAPGAEAPAASSAGAFARKWRRKSLKRWSARPESSRLRTRRG